MAGGFFTSWATREALWSEVKMLVAQLCLTLCHPMDCILPGSCPWDFPGKNTGVGCHCLLQGIFVTQESNPGMLYYRQILYHLNHQRSSSCLYIWHWKQGTNKKKINWGLCILETFILQRIPSRRWKDNSQNGRKYSQIICLIRDLCVCVCLCVCVFVCVCIYMYVYKNLHSSIRKDNPTGKEKIGKGSEQTLLHRRYTNDKHTKRYLILVIDSLRSHGL